MRICDKSLLQQILATYQRIMGHRTCNLLRILFDYHELFPNVRDGEPKLTKGPSNISPDTPKETGLAWPTGQGTRQSSHDSELC